MQRRQLLAAAAVLGLATATGCSGGGDPASAAEDPDALVVYNAQHESMTTVWAQAFTKETGIKVALRHGKDFELGNQLIAEGAQSKADVFLTENSPAMSLVEGAGLLSDVDPGTLAQVPRRYSTTTGKWVGIAARSTVFVYHTRLGADDLPASMLDLAKPEWAGRWGAAPAGADFQAVASALLLLEGEDVTSEWLAAMKAGSKPYSGNNTLLQGVNAGEVDGGLSYHYYWYRDQAKTKENSGNARLHFFGNQDPGAFVSVSGGGVLAAAKHPSEAQRFLEFVTGPVGQQALADSQEYEYTVGSDIPANPALEPLSELDSPVVDPSRLNGPMIIEMMTDAGLI